MLGVIDKNFFPNIIMQDIKSRHKKTVYKCIFRDIFGVRDNIYSEYSRMAPREMYCPAVPWYIGLCLYEPRTMYIVRPDIRR